jgi:tetratricopeptide (TPR) repeat protein
VARREVRFEDAEHWLRRALNVYRSVLPEDDPRIAETQAKLAFALYNRGDEALLAEAERLYHEVLQWVGTSSVETRAAALEGLADINLERGEDALRKQQNQDSVRTFFTRSRDLYRESIDIRLAEYEHLRPGVARAMWGLGRVLSQLGEVAEAVEVNRRALDIFLAVYREEHRDVAFGWYYLGLAQSRNEDNAAAFDSYQRATALLRKIYGDDYVYTAASFTREGEALVRLGRLEDAHESLENAIRAYRAIVSRDGNDESSRQAYGRTLAIYSELLGKEGRLVEALRALRESHDIAVQTKDTRAVSGTAAELARLFEQVGQADSAAVFRSIAVTSRDDT